MTENIKNGSVLRVHPRNNNKKILFNFCFPSYNFPGTEEKLQELCPEDWGARQVQSGSAPQTQTEMRSPLEHLTEKVSTSSSLPTAAFPASLLSTAAIPGSVCAGMCRDVPGCAGMRRAGQGGAAAGGVGAQHQEDASEEGGISPLPR